MTGPEPVACLLQAVAALLREPTSCAGDAYLSVDCRRTVYHALEAAHAAALGATAGARRDEIDHPRARGP